MFSEPSLHIFLQLSFENKWVDIQSGNIKACELNLHAYGFEGKAEFGLFSDNKKDELFTSFITQDLIKVRIGIMRHGSAPRDYDAKRSEYDKNLPVDIVGYVTKKSVRESIYHDVKKDPVLKRHYEISFQDIPAVLWKQHFPVKLYTDKKMSEVIKDQKPKNIKFEVDDGIQETPMDMIFLGLEKRLYGPSFYDFFMWHAQENNIVLNYDYEDQTLKWFDKKPSPKPDDEVFLPNEVASLHTFFSETFRYNTRILNVHSKEEGKEIEIENDQAVDGIVQDIVMRTAIQKDLDDRKSLEAKRIENRLEKIKMVLNDFPTKRFGIGTMVKFEKEHWSKNNLLSKKNFRVFHIQLSAHAQDQELSAHYDAHFAAYDMNMVIEMELEDTPEIHLPRFKLPNYPLQVEGKIVSESGADDEKTYQFYTNEESSQEDYTVLVPFWDLEIKAPYVPGVFTGHFYFPAFKDARVLLDLYLDRAVIKGFLDWGEGSRLPMDTQGNHLLFGKTAQSQTSMKYLYTEDKPVFTIKRTSDTDTEMIQMEEESIIIQTKDEED